MILLNPSDFISIFKVRKAIIGKIFYNFVLEKYYLTLLALQTCLALQNLKIQFSSSS